MNNLEFISVDNVIENWKMIAPNEINYNEDLLREWIIDSYYDIGTYKQYKQRVQILNVKDFKVKLPYYKKAAAGKLDLNEAKKEFAATYKKISTSMSQIEFQREVGRLEVLGELIIKNK